MDVSISRSDKGFRSALASYVAQEGISYRDAAELLDLNVWHINQFLENPRYRPSKEVRDKCNIRLRPPDKRVIVHRGSDMNEKASQIEELTDGKYTIVEKRMVLR